MNNGDNAPHIARLREKYLDQPNEVSLETLTKCNARCTFCPYPDLGRIGTKMPDELIDKVIREFATWEEPFWFSPFKVSEALLDKRLYPILKRMNKEVPHALTRIFTNGAALTWNNAEKLNDCNNLVLNISLNTHRKAEYEALMGISYDRTIKNIDELHASDFRHPVTVQRVGTDPVFNEFCEKRWPRFANACIKTETWTGWLGEELIAVPESQGCPRWYELNVTAAGLAVLCCVVDGSKPEHYLPINDISKYSLLEIYNQPHLRIRREQSLSRKGLPICGTCSY